MKRITRKELIEAYKNVLKEYINYTHVAKTRNCAKCKLVGKIDNFDSCNNCPETIFNKDTGCRHRYTDANNSASITPKHCKNIIEYHKEAIKYLENIKYFNLNRFKNKLLSIDNKIRKRYEKSN